MVNREQRRRKRRRRQPPPMIGLTIFLAVTLHVASIITLAAAFVLRHPPRHHLSHHHHAHYTYALNHRYSALSAVGDPSADNGGAGPSSTTSTSSISAAEAEAATADSTTSVSATNGTTTTTITTTLSNNNNNNNNNYGRFELRRRVAELARRRLTANPWLRKIAPMPRAVATVLRDATLGALDLAVDEGTWEKVSYNYTGPPGYHAEGTHGIFRVASTGVSQSFFCQIIIRYYYDCQFGWL
jgi:hypothetical protein